MTTTALSLIVKAQKILQDVAGVSWDGTELLGWLNEGQYACVELKPTAYVKSLPVQLAAGTKQTIPADGVQLVDVLRNTDAAGAPGRVVRIVEREVLDSFNPDWHSSTPNAIVKHYMFAATDPKRFYVFPPQPSVAGFVEMVYSAAPPDALSTGNITLDDIYAPALVDYILYRAFSKDTEFAADGGQALAHQQAFLAALTGKSRAELSSNPNQTAPSSSGGYPKKR